MKLSIATAFLAIAYTAVDAHPANDGALVARNDCGAGYPAYTRRTGSPCGASNGSHKYCGCDKTGVVRVGDHMNSSAFVDR